MLPRRGMVEPPASFRSVLKFGGSCLKSSLDISAIAERILELDSNPVVVVSAFYGVTDRLLDAIHDARNGRLHISTFVHWIRSHHTALTPEILTSPSLERFESTIQNLDFNLRNIESDGAEVEVLVTGERLATTCLEAALTARGVVCQAFWAEDIPIIVKGRDPFIRINRTATSESIELPGDTIPLCAGWYGIGSDGDLSTLSRGGSDCTAACIASAIGASSVVIWRDVPGVLSIDPAWGMPGRRIPYLNYDEAVEIASYSSRLLHPDAIDPLVESGIPLIIRPLHHPNEPGTYVGPSISVGHPNVRVLVCHRRRFDILWQIRSGSQLSRNLIGLGRILHQKRIRIWSIRADTAGIRVLVDEKDLPRVEAAILSFDSEARIDLGKPIALLSLFGQGISSDSSIRSLLLDSLEGRGFHPEEMNQEGTEHGIHLLIPDKEAVETVGCLTDMFELLDAE